jgi:hypothetical protein
MTSRGGNAKGHHPPKFAVDGPSESPLAGVATISMLSLEGANFFGVARLACAVEAFHSEL